MAPLSRRQALILMGAVLAGSGKAQEPLRIRLAANGHFAPFNYLDPSGRFVGILVDALNWLGSQSGIVFDYVDVPWPRGQQWVRLGQLDGFCTTETIERRQFVKFVPTPIYEDRAAVLHRAGELADISSRGLGDLAGLRLGAPRGSGWSKEILAGLEVIWVPDISNLLAMIAAGRLDASIGGEGELKAALAAYPGKKSLAVSDFPAVPGGAFSLGLRKGLRDCDSIVARLDEAAQKLRESGEMRAIHDRYLQQRGG